MGWSDDTTGAGMRGVLVWGERQFEISEFQISDVVRQQKGKSKGVKQKPKAKARARRRR
jgi:hypothetical protein